MKKQKVIPGKSMAVLCFAMLAIVCIHCKNKQQVIYSRLMDHCNSIKIINTHEHQRNPSDFKIQKYNIFNLLEQSYLKSDLVSAGSPDINDDMINNHTEDELWDTYGDYLDYSINTSYYKQLYFGFRNLYGYDAPDFNQEDMKPFSEKISENYNDYKNWFDKAFHKANYQIMFLDPYWDPYNFELDTNYFALVFDIDDMVYGIGKGAQKKYKDELPDHKYYKLARKEKFTIRSMDEYLAFADHLFQKALKNNAVCIKNSMAYGRSIDYENVSYEEANKLFKKAPSISGAEEKALQDFMFHWIIKKSIEHDLPVQIHTGYLAGTGNLLNNGQPIKLNKLFSEYPEAKFIIFHGGYPWTGEFIALGKMFSNVYFDIVWLPSISKEAAIRTFNEILDCVPYNKIFWGGDCHFIEESVGSLEIGKEVVIQVLSDRILKGSMTEDIAHDVINSIFRKNAVSVFNLKEK